jgi:hypothetical protein
LVGVQDPKWKVTVRKRKANDSGRKEQAIVRIRAKDEVQATVEVLRQYPYWEIMKVEKIT